MITLDKLNKQEALRYLGCAAQVPDENTEKLIEECEREILKAAKPKYLYKAFDIAFTEDGVLLEECSILLTGSDIKEHLEGCFGAVLMCATISSDIDRIIRTAQVTDMAKAVIMNSLASVAVEQVCEKTELIINDEFKDCEKTWRYSPGYGDLPIELQKDILTVLDAPKKIGLCTGNTSMLLPVKSVTAIIGLSKEKVNRKRRGCISCNLKETCQFRKVGNRCV